MEEGKWEPSKKTRGERWPGYKRSIPTTLCSLKMCRSKSYIDQSFVYNSRKYQLVNILTKTFNVSMLFNIIFGMWATEWTFVLTRSRFAGVRRFNPPFVEPWSHCHNVHEPRQRLTTPPLLWLPFGLLMGLEMIWVEVYSWDLGSSSSLV